ncbi:hypothetical protein HDU93_005047 [Gonapodya sp. JEL0774]|nr:hypothetical protein HDU93_005047 [Gonapodya sp. JEL0774]
MKAEAPPGALHEDNGAIRHRTALIKAQVFGVSLDNALLDSGANFPAIRADIYRDSIAGKYDFRKRANACKIRMTLGVSGTYATSIGIVFRATICLADGPPVTQWLHVVEHLHRPLVLGTDFQTSTGLLINWRAQTLQFPLSWEAKVKTTGYSTPIAIDVRFDAEPAVDEHDAYGVLLADAVHIPGESRAYVRLIPADLGLRVKENEGREVSTTANDLFAARDGVMIAKGVHKMEVDGVISTLLTNWTTSPILVPANSRVASFEFRHPGDYIAEMNEIAAEPVEFNLRFDCRGNEVSSRRNEPVVFTPKVAAAAEIEGLDLSQSDLRDEERDRLMDFLKKNRDVFSIGDTPGLVSTVEHRIDLVDGAQPIKSRPHRVGPSEKATISKGIVDML